MTQSQLEHHAGNSSSKWYSIAVLPMGVYVCGSVISAPPPPQAASGEFTWSLLPCVWGGGRAGDIY